MIFCTVFPCQMCMGLHEIYSYVILTEREVKTARYWPSSFVALSWAEAKSRSIKTQKKAEVNIQPSRPNKLDQERT